MKYILLTVALIIQFDLAKLNLCFEREIDQCLDKICEMSTDDNAEIIKQLQSNIMDCLREK